MGQNTGPWFRLICQEATWVTGQNNSGSLMDHNWMLYCISINVFSVSLSNTSKMSEKSKLNNQTHMWVGWFWAGQKHWPVESEDSEVPVIQAKAASFFWNLIIIFCTFLLFGCSFSSASQRRWISSSEAGVKRLKTSVPTGGSRDAIVAFWSSAHTPLSPSNCFLWREREWSQHRNGGPACNYKKLLLRENYTDWTSAAEKKTVWFHPTVNNWHDVKPVNVHQFQNHVLGMFCQGGWDLHKFSSTYFRAFFIL